MAASVLRALESLCKGENLSLELPQAAVKTLTDKRDIARFFAEYRDYLLKEQKMTIERAEKTAANSIGFYLQHNATTQIRDLWVEATPVLRGPSSGYYIK